MYLGKSSQKDCKSACLVFGLTGCVWTKNNECAAHTMPVVIGEAKPNIQCLVLITGDQSSKIQKDSKNNIHGRVLIKDGTEHKALNKLKNEFPEKHEWLMGNKNISGLWFFDPETVGSGLDDAALVVLITAVLKAAIAAGFNAVMMIGTPNVDTLPPTLELIPSCKLTGMKDNSLIAYFEMFLIFFFTSISFLHHTI